MNGVAPEATRMFSEAAEAADVVARQLSANAALISNLAERLRAVSIDVERARLLGVEPGAAVLYIERRGFLDDGRVIEATQSWYRGDAYDFVAELNARA